MAAARYEVHHDGRLALTITDEPGALVSRLSPPPPPGAPVATHPFLTASAHIPEREDELRRILDESGSTAEFLDRLRAAGYTVAPVD